MPRLSIVIPNHGYARFLPGLFACLAAQTGGLAEAEVVFVDDESPDGSLELARELGATLACESFRAVGLSRKGRPGPVRNAGASRSRGALLLFLDPDDLLEPDFLTACREALDRDAAADLAYTDYLHEEEGGVRAVALPEFDPQLLAVQNILPPAALLRRTVWERVGGFKDNTAYEDWDFWVRAAAEGFRGRRVPRPLYRHRVHGANFSFAARREDGPAKAALVGNCERFFHPKVRAWARALLAGEPWAAPLPRGIIPRAEDVDRLLGQIRDGLRTERQ